MLEIDFSRIVLIIVLGFIIMIIMVVMAKSNPINQNEKTPKFTRVIGGLLFFIGFLCLAASLVTLPSVQHPYSEISFSPADLAIIRSPDKHIVWGYPTPTQYASIVVITFSWILIGSAFYCFFYRESKTKWWEKILKLFFGIFIYIIYLGVTDFHYFDSPEWFPRLFIIGIIVILFYFVYLRKRKKKRIVKTIEKQELPKGTEETVAIIVEKKENHTRFMPKSAPTTTSVVEEESNLSEQIQEGSPKKYCRYCGKQIDNNSQYCKYCGKQNQ